MKISQRLGLLIALAIGGLLILAVTSFLQLNRVYTELENISDNVMPSMQTLAAFDSALLEQRNSLLAHILSSDDSKMGEIAQSFAEHGQHAAAALDKYAPMIVNEQDRDYHGKLKEGLAELGRVYAPILDASRSNRKEEAQVMANSARVIFQRINGISKQHTQFNQQLADSAKQHAIDVNQQAKLIAATVAAVAILLLCFSGWRTYRQVVGSVSRAQQSIRQLAETLDFTTRCEVQGKDEIALMLGAFNQLIAKMQDSLRTMITAARDVSQSATELAGSARQVAAGSSAQSESAATMAAALEQITVSINHVADRAIEANHLAQDTGARAQQGEQVIGDTTQSIESIAGAVDSASSEMAQLVARTRDIATVVSVIKDVAEQTNLLALNAAIEAARAGETGRGFAVVADEVRKLAERTALSTQEIAQIINAIQSVSGSAAERMQGAVHNVANGVGEAAKARSTMQSISDVAGQSRHLVGEISSAIREQGSAANSIAQQVETVAQMAEENSAAAGHVTELANRLQGLSQGMEQEVSVYRV
ncbi:methyl-accepting chemotaxis protein [Vogesella indigofera]|uniref:methyl-accepting chemotaxis protein n=1 Tax=Vogesella indigofera TaxID=45465 RepID=UPI00234F3170|nr:methyl-accepting chemotaxis protein [Vogesella indigofera]MDC7701101.1 methyl-accepting chemotaxis protein [Vogesella indigofera]